MDYKSAYAIAQKYRKLIGIGEKTAFWDAHPSLFRDATVIVFDTQEQTFFPHHYRSQDSIIGDLPLANSYRIGIEPKELAFDNLLSWTEREIYRYDIVHIYPNDISEFWEFVIWCLDKYKSPESIGKSFSIIDVAYYWKEIRQHRFPDERLLGLLDFAEKERSKISTLKTPYGIDILDLKEAKEYFYFFGEKVASQGAIAMGGLSGATSTLYDVYQKTLTYPPKVYGEIFYEFYDALHTVDMLRFFRQQKKRLERLQAEGREDEIRFPEVKHSETAEEPTAEPVINASEPQRMNWVRRQRKLQQLMSRCLIRIKSNTFEGYYPHYRDWAR